MLIEGIDDSVLIIFSLLIILLVTIMLNYIRSSMLSVRQVNPQLHADSVNEVNRLRIESNLSPSAPPMQPEDISATRTSSSASSSSRRRNNFSSQLSCPICLGTAILPIETNCGHIFCANCIIQYWKHLTSNIFHSKMKCPMCRQLVTCLLPLYDRPTQEQFNSEYSEVFNHIGTYNRRFSGAPRPLWDYITDLPILLRHALNEMFSLNGIEIWYRIRLGFLLIVGLFYFISPLDIVPEAIFGFFGFFDDFLVFFLLAIYISIMYRQFIANRR